MHHECAAGTRIRRSSGPHLPRCQGHTWKTCLANPDWVNTSIGNNCITYSRRKPHAMKSQETEATPLTGLVPHGMPRSIHHTGHCSPAALAMVEVDAPCWTAWRERHHLWERTAAAIGGEPPLPCQADTNQLDGSASPGVCDSCTTHATSTLAPMQGVEFNGIQAPTHPACCCNHSPQKELQSQHHCSAVTQLCAHTERTAMCATRAQLVLIVGCGRTT